MVQSEKSIHKSVADYLKIQYPKIIFRTDFAAGIHMTMNQAVQHKGLQSGRAYPDLFIAKPTKKSTDPNHPTIVEAVAEWERGGRLNLEFYAGMFLELKRPDVQLKRVRATLKILKGDTKLRMPGDWWDPHIEEQANMLEQLRELGYYAQFAVGFDAAKLLIDWYLHPM